MRDDKLVQVEVRVTLPSYYLQEFLQAIKNFETKDANHFADCLVLIGVTAPSMPTEEVARIMRSINPPFDDMRVIKVKK